MQMPQTPTLYLTPSLTKALLALWLVLAVAQVSAGSVHIRHATLISPDSPYSGQVMNVLIREGRISAIDRHEHPADEVIDAAGQFLIPGLIDSHVHLQGIPGYRPADEPPAWLAAAEAQLPRSYLYFGFTTLLDLASTPATMESWRRQPLVPDTYFCGAVSIVNGYPLSFIPPSQPLPQEVLPYLLYDPRQHAQTPAGVTADSNSAEAIAARMAGDGAICLKTFYETGFGPKKNLPVPTVAMGRALVRAAHKHDLPVFLHANAEAAYDYGVHIGADILAHGLWHWDNLSTGEALSAFVARLAEEGMAVQPTLQVLYGERDVFDKAFLQRSEARAVMPAELIDWYGSEPGQWMKTLMGEQFSGDHDHDLHHQVTEAYQHPLGNVKAVVRELLAQEVPLLFGSDTPSGPFYTQFPGLNGYLEIQRWAEAGVGAEQILRALTIDNARALGIDNTVGSIAAGKRANLLLLAQNPLATTVAYDSIVSVILAGQLVPRDSLRADR